MKTKLSRVLYTLRPPYLLESGMQNPNEFAKTNKTKNQYNAFEQQHNL